MSLKCYSDWHLGAIEIELTALTLGITEDSAKQLVINLLYTGISMIGLLVRERILFFLLITHFCIYLRYFDLILSGEIPLLDPTEDY